MIDDRFEAGQAAVMHIGCGECQLPQCGYFKKAVVGSLERQSLPAAVLVHFIQSVVGKSLVGKQESAVTVGTGQPLVVKKLVASFGSLRNSG